MFIDPSNYGYSTKKNNQAAESGRKYPKTTETKPSDKNQQANPPQRPVPPAPQDKTELSRESKELKGVGSAAQFGALLAGLGESFGS